MPLYLLSLLNVGAVISVDSAGVGQNEAVSGYVVEVDGMCAHAFNNF